VTSRAALHVYGEHDFRYALALPDSKSNPSLEALSKCPAIALSSNAPPLPSRISNLTGKRARGHEICGRLDGLPLAIEARSRPVKVLSLTSMQTRLESGCVLTAARGLPQRQQTLRATIDWSYDLLSPAEQNSSEGCRCSWEDARWRAWKLLRHQRRSRFGLARWYGIHGGQELLQQVEQANGESRFVMLERFESTHGKTGGKQGRGLTRRAHAAYCLVLAEEEVTEQAAR